MPLKSIRNPASIISAIAEFRRIGRQAFLKKYGFHEAREYYLVFEGERFDSKAIIGAAHGYEFPDLGPLRSDQFSGGATTVERKLRELGFTVESGTNSPIDPLEDTEGKKKASDLLQPRAIYTRDQLKRILTTQDATINTGVFRPAGFSSIMLFITRDKTQDRTQYEDRLDGDVLHWQGQSKGRTDPLIIEHQQRGLELLVFYRERKYEYAGAAFRYEGRFRYLSHTGTEPANFVLRREIDDIVIAAAEAEKLGIFDPSNAEDGRTKTLAAIVRRQGQPAFRRELLRAYGGRCAITGCQITEVLEAAHILPYRGPQTNHVTNGLLLRADLHTLFDLQLIAVNPTLKTVIVAPFLRDTDYGRWHGSSIHLPVCVTDSPSEDALRMHLEATGLSL